MILFLLLVSVVDFLRSEIREDGMRSEQRPMKHDCDYKFSLHTEDLNKFLVRREKVLGITSWRVLLSSEVDRVVVCGTHARII